MLTRISLVPLLAAGALLAAAPGDPDPKTLDKKVLFGYQGWFNCAGDGAPENNWRSWSRGCLLYTSPSPRD